MTGSPASSRVALRADGNRLADLDHRVKRLVDAHVVGEVLLESLDRFDDALGRFFSRRM